MAVANIVARHLENDVVAVEAMRRGIVNLRGLARWLREEQGLEASEEGIVSALRRYRPEAGGDYLGTARAVLSKAHVNSRTNIAFIVLPKNEQVQRRLPDLLKHVKILQGDTLRVIQGERTIKVVIDDENLPKVIELFGPDTVTGMMRDVVELNVVIDKDGLDTPGVLALIFITLALREINILEAISGVPEIFVFVAKQDAVPAYDALLEMTSAVHGRNGQSPSADTGKSLHVGLSE